MIELKDHFDLSPAWNQAKAIIANCLHDAGYRDWQVTIQPLRNADDDDDEWSIRIDQRRRTATFEVPGRVMEYMGFEEIGREVAMRIDVAVEIENQTRRDQPRQRAKPLSPWLSPSTFSRSSSTPPYRDLPDEEGRGV